VHGIEPWILVGMAGVLTLAGVVAAWGPARRAGLVDPIVALREE
jgi:ABC-type antimicrobial peptide transport system permease subunit